MRYTIKGIVQEFPTQIIKVAYSGVMYVLEILKFLIIKTNC